VKSLIKAVVPKLGEVWTGVGVLKRGARPECKTLLQSYAAL